MRPLLWGKKCKIDVFLKNSSSLLPGIGRQIKYLVIITKVGSTKFVNFYDPRARGSSARVWIYKTKGEMHYFFFKSSSLLPGIDQTNLVYSNDDHGKVYQNFNFRDPRGRVLVLGCGRISHIVEIHFSYKNLLLYSQA